MFNRITKVKGPSNPLPEEQKDSVFNRLGDRNEVQSAISPCMKQFSILDVKTDGFLRVRRRTVVFTGQPRSFDTDTGDG